MDKTSEGGVAGRRWTLTLDEIVEAARRLIRRDGLESLSMRAVANELGVATMTTYTHVASKDELIGMVHEAVSQEWAPIELTDDGWEAGLRRFLLSQWETYQRYPGLAAWSMQRPDFGTRPESYAAWIEFFTKARFTARDAVLAWSVSQTYLMGRLAVDARLGGGPPNRSSHGLRARHYVERGVEVIIAGIRETSTIGAEDRPLPSSEPRADDAPR